MRIINRLAAEKQPKAAGKLLLLKEKILSCYRKELPNAVTSILNRLSTELPDLRWEVHNQIANTFHAFENFLRKFFSNSKEPKEDETKLRILPHHQYNPEWKEEIIALTDPMIQSIKKYAHTLHNLEIDIDALKNNQLDERTEGIRYDIQALAERLIKACTTMESFLDRTIDSNKVKWIEMQSLRSQTNMRLIHSDLDISSLLAENLFNPFSTVTLCSATLTTNRRFDFIRNRLGIVPAFLSDRVVTENVYDSPFSYPLQAILGVPTDLPLPSDPTFVERASEAIFDIVTISEGNAFALFTSYAMLNACYQKIHQRLSEQGFCLLKQGDDNRQSLLNTFRMTNRSILFGTSSFWEGVDVVGDALRCVIIVKLPFQVPSEPMVQARTEAILANGGDPFFEYSVPNAIVKFKQGFGRLIRSKQDRGCIVCLDSRLINKGYGGLFLNSLPPCRQLFADSKTLKNQMREFYRFSKKENTWN
jgi:ATP-dependent DNA helicase DinG